MKVWVVFTEREWDWQTHKSLDSIHATEASADARDKQLNYRGVIEEFEVTAANPGTEREGT